MGSEAGRMDKGFLHPYRRQSQASLRFGRLAQVSGHGASRDSRMSFGRHSAAIAGHYKAAVEEEDMLHIRSTGDVRTSRAAIDGA